MFEGTLSILKRGQQAEATALDLLQEMAIKSDGGLSPYNEAVLREFSNKINVLMGQMQLSPDRETNIQWLEDTNIEFRDFLLTIEK
jgi:hypothetical protein